MLTFKAMPAGEPPASDLLAALLAELYAMYGPVDGPDMPSATPADFAPPRGTFLVGFDAGGAPVCCGGVKGLGDGAAEIKRMYVVPELRGRGLARTVLAELERTAAAAGHDVLVLETGLRQPEAIALYASSGYAPIPDFGHYCGDDLVRSFGKRI